MEKNEAEPNPAIQQWTTGTDDGQTMRPSIYGIALHWASYRIYRYDLL